MNKDDLLEFLEHAELPSLFDKEEDPEFIRLKNKVKRICSFSEQSSYQLRQRLKREGFEQEQVERVIAYAQEVYLLDDRRYAELLVPSLVAKGYGQQEIIRRLKEINVEAQELDSWKECFEGSQDKLPEESEEDRAYEYLCRHPSHSKHPEQASIAKLVRRGYSYGIARRATARWMEDRTC